MAKKIISHGEQLDKLKADIEAALVECKKEEARLTKAGVQIGTIHFKTDRPNIMYILEPTNQQGRRPYVHVGVDTAKQADARVRVDRWRKRDALRRAMISLEEELWRMNHQIQHVLHIVSSVHEHAAMIVETHMGAGNG
jgi:hypothetical protein